MIPEIYVAPVIPSQYASLHNVHCLSSMNRMMRDEYKTIPKKLGATTHTAHSAQKINILYIRACIGQDH